MLQFNFPQNLKEYLLFFLYFFRELLMQKHFELFEKWLYKFSKEIILLSSKYSLISGFYKLNTLCMRIAIKIGYFNVKKYFVLFSKSPIKELSKKYISLEPHRTLLCQYSTDCSKETWVADRTP
jgi:hypothetical protein